MTTAGPLSAGLLAAVPDLPEVARPSRAVGPDTTSMVAMVLMAVLVVVLGVVVWAVFIRKPARATERGRLVEAKKRDESSEGQRGRRRRRRRERRGRNPTLAETGGLPGRKDTDEPPLDP